MKANFSLYKQCVHALWEDYLRENFALLLPLFLFGALLLILEYFDVRPADPEDDASNANDADDAVNLDDAHHTDQADGSGQTKGSDQADGADRAKDADTTAIKHPRSLREAVEIESKIKPEESEADHQREVENRAKKMRNGERGAGVKHSSRPTTMRDVERLELPNGPRKPSELPQFPNVELNELIEEDDQGPEEQPFSKSSTVVLELEAGKSSPTQPCSKASTVVLELGAGRSSSSQPNLRIASKTNFQTDLQGSTTSPAAPVSQASQDLQYRARRVTSNNFHSPINVRLAKRQKHRLSPTPEEQELKRQKPLPGEASIPLAPLTSFEVEDSMLSVPRLSTEKPVRTGYVLRTESLTEPVFSLYEPAQEPESVQDQGSKLQRKEVSNPEAPGIAEAEAKIAAAMLVNLSRGAGEVHAHVKHVRALLGENEEVYDDITTATTMPVNFSRGGKVAVRPESANSAHLVKSPSKMDPTVARNTRNTPREGDYAAFMRFMKTDNPEDEELRAKKRRENNAVIRDRQDAYAKLKEEIKARKE
ncbi:hypothetical protein BLS_003967 [Venturia inaequalis]|uniref:Uncharacterized protein n=1 Tax=Venturia inaequalis TaxID=5025 RepID=A0A8H3UPT8_VENIN|nr:hypothetical protein BLS_003967 [Venturia inaequalis]RDI87546.1 hypothetical protein Vi05172_g2588 [Venturia inaequalis]